MNVRRRWLYYGGGVAATLVILACFTCGGVVVGTRLATRSALQATVLPTLSRRPIAPVPIATIASAPTSSPSPTPMPTSSATPSRFVEAQVVGIVDGDTIRVSLGGQEYSVRYIGMDCPEIEHPDEPAQPWGPEASAANATLVAGRIVRLEKDVSETDTHDRLLRYVYIGDVMVDRELVRLGLARAKAYPPDTTHQPELIAAENEARIAGVGLWASPVPAVATATAAVTASTPAPTAAVATPPTTPTHVALPVSAVAAPSDACTYKASKKSAPFHHAYCQWADKISADNLQCFATREEAIAAGHRSCKVCNP